MSTHTHRLIPLLAFSAALAATPATAAVVTFEAAPASFLSYTDSGATVTAALGSVIAAPSAVNGTRSIISVIDDPFAFSAFRADFAALQFTVAVDLGDFGDDADALFLRAYDSTDTLLASGSATLAAGVTAMLTLSVSAPGIAYVTFGGVSDPDGDSSVYADNLSFTDVPEPASALLLAGGLLGLAVRRRG